MTHHTILPMEEEEEEEKEKQSPLSMPMYRDGHRFGRFVPVTL
jgi:hypothetical protein